MGWELDPRMEKVREILKERYSGCGYSALTSLSPISIDYCGEITEEEREQIVLLFPDLIRVSFSKVRKQ